MLGARIDVMAALVERALASLQSQHAALFLLKVTVPGVDTDRAIPREACSVGVGPRPVVEKARPRATATVSALGALVAHLHSSCGAAYGIGHRA